MPSPRAAIALKHRLVEAGVSIESSTIWSWDDLWRRVRQIKAEGPMLASTAALRAVLAEALALAGRDEELSHLPQPWYSAGFLSRLSRKMEHWTRLGIDETSPLPDDPRSRTERLIFRAYRALLTQIGWQDTEGFAVWAASAMRERAVLDALPASRVYLVGLPESRAGELAVAALNEVARSMTIVLGEDAARARLHFRPNPREMLLDRDFVEETIASRAGTPRGIMRVLDGFRSGTTTPRSPEIDGLSVLGGPEPDGQVLTVARRVRDLLDLGVSLDEILVVTPQRDDLRARIVETLRSWRIPASHDLPRPMATDPGILALRLAMNLTVEGWETDDLVALLRHGRVKPGWPELDTPRKRHLAAKAVRESRVHRGAQTLRNSLFRKAEADRFEGRAAVALAAVDRLLALFDGLDEPRTWRERVESLFSIAGALGLGEIGSLLDLRSALDDQGEFFRKRKQHRETWTWTEFCDDVQATIRALESAPTPLPCEGVRVLGPESISGLVARHVILAGLGEGTFPSRSAVEVARMDAGTLDRVFDDEKARFLAVLSMAEESLSLIYPTTDAKGNPLLAASFLDDVRSLFTEEAWSRANATIPRLGAILPAEFAGSDNEARVLAVARACLQSRTDTLDRLLADPSHRDSLSGVACSLLMAHWRSRRSRFDRFDGRLSDPRILARLATMIGTREQPFSASHLESMAECPFKFFQRYILRLAPTDDPDEIQEDYASRGSLLHDALETLHSRLRDMPDTLGRSLAERVESGVSPAIEQVLQGQPEPNSEIERGLSAIEAERLRRLGRRYARQFRRYAEKDGRDAVGKHFELGFGRPEHEFPPLQIGEEPRMIAVSGIIDRIDFVHKDGVAAFRVIDYKSGAAIKESDLQQGIALQLPLYAMAAERLILTDQGARLQDFAYWSIREKGFRLFKTLDAVTRNAGTWKQFTASLESYLMALVDRIHAGDLPLSPRKADCRSHCDYQYICRISHTGASGKSWPEQPILEIPL